jgi:tight adherence protein C
VVDLLGIDARAALIGILAGLAAALAALAVAKPLPRLAPRVRPYNSANRVRLGRPADIDGPHQTGALSGGAFVAVFGPMLMSAARLVDREDDEALLVRLRNAAYCPELAPEERLQRYRVERLAYAAAAVAAAVAVGWLAGSARLLVAGSVAGLVGGLALPRARLDSAVRRRRDHMTIDLHAINHHLAMAQKTGSGIDEALQRLVRRGRGPVVAELADALRWRRAGTPLPEALRLLAARTAEPHAARTYKALAKAAETGAPIGEALLHLSEDVRHSRRDALERLAVKRRMAMIVPTVFLMIPPLLLLIGAPVIAEVFGSIR